MTIPDFEQPVPIFIQVLSASVDKISGVSQSTGRPYAASFQTAFIMNDGLGSYPAKFKIYLQKGESAYAPGWYCLLPQSFDVDENKQLIIRPKLMPVETPQRASR